MESTLSAVHGIGSTDLTSIYVFLYAGVLGKCTHRRKVVLMVKESGAANCRISLALLIVLNHLFLYSIFFCSNSGRGIWK